MLNNMAIDPITGWFIKWVCGKLADKALKRLVSNKDLAKKLDKAVADWANSFPKEDRYVNPAALFPDISSLTEKDRPKYYSLQQKLTENKLPSKKNWHEVFMESWLSVKKNFSEPQPFFKLSEQQASEELRKLAQATYEVCKQYEPIFKSHVVDKLDDIGGDVKYIRKHLPDKGKKLEGGKQIHNLPYASIGNLFKGRDEILDSLKKELSESKVTAITQSIQGLGGIGKTRLALEFGWWALENRKYRFVFFVSSEKPEILQASLAGLTGEKVLDLGGEKEVEQISSVMRWLNSNRNWLMIIDNADSEAAAEAVEELLPHLLSGRVIITSRYTRWSGAVVPQTLGLLEPKKAKEFLLQRTKGRRIETDKDEQLAEQLSDKLGYLPLALEQAGAYIAHRKCSMSDYLQEWKDERERVLKWYNKREMQYDVSVAVTWQRTFEQLKPSAIAVLRISSFLAPEMIPIDMFEKGEEIIKQALTLQCKEMKAKEGKFELKETLSDLAAYSMITREEKGFTVHRIVQEVLRSRIPEEYRKVWVEKALRIVNDYAPTESFDVRTWPVWDVLRPHAELIAETANKEKITEPTARLMNDLGLYLKYKAIYNKAERWYQRALKIDESSFGPNHPNVARDLNNLASLLQATNRLSEAEPLYRRVVKIFEKSLGENHPNVATALNNLASLLQATSRLSEAEPLVRRALKIDEDSFGPNHPKVAIRLNNLALLLKATKRFTEAEPMYRRALEIWENSLGENHPNVASALNNLAELLRETGRFDEAEPMYRRALKIDEQSFGTNHPDVARDLNNLALLLQATNRLSEAEPLMRRALKIFEDSLGPDHPSTKTVRNNLRSLK